MKYFTDWYREFISTDNKNIIISLIATGIIAPIMALLTKELIEKIRKK